MDWYYIAGRGAHGDQFIRASRTNCQPAESSGMSGKGANPQEQVPCPQCGKKVQRRYLRKHERSPRLTKSAVRDLRSLPPTTKSDRRPSLRSVVVVPSGQEQPEESPDQQELGPAVSGDRMTLVRPVASPVTSLPHTPGRDIVIAGNTEELPRTREGRLAAATLEQEMGRRSVAEAIRPIRERAVASSSSAERAITQEMVAEACDTLVSDASDEPGPKEDPPHLRARSASDLEGDPEAAELDQEEAGGAEPSAQLELAILNGLDISSGTRSSGTSLRDEECCRSRDQPEGAPGQMERSPRRGIEERRSQRQASPWNHPLPRYKNRVGDGG